MTRAMTMVVRGDRVDDRGWALVLACGHTVQRDDRNLTRLSPGFAQMKMPRRVRCEKCAEGHAPWCRGADMTFDVEGGPWFCRNCGRAPREEGQP